MKAGLTENPHLEHTRTHEYGSYIMEAMVENKPYKIGGNVINNGVIVSLDERSSWTVCGSCYLSSLTVAPGAVIRPEHGTLTLTVDGKAVELRPGTYTGDVQLTVF